MVLILSENGDVSTNSVIDWLNYYSIEWLRINETDQVTFSCIEYRQDKLVKFEIKVNGKILDLLCVTSYWYRRGFLNFTERKLRDNIATDPQIHNNLARYLGEEMDNLNAFVHAYLRETKIQLNSLLTATNDKTFYQFIAVQSGLCVPDTLISNEMRSALTFATGKPDNVVTKSINEGFGFNYKDYTLYSTTSAVSSKDISASASYFFPTLFQESISKYVELRIFYLDGAMYSMAIFSQQNEKTRLDFRNYDYDHPNRCVPFQLPEEIRSRVIDFMSRIKLNSGSIDMILTPEGRYVFLEVNPVGQFGMVSYPCNYFLEQKIADYLSHGRK